VEKILARLALGSVTPMLIVQEFLARILILIHDVYCGSVLSELACLVLLNEFVSGTSNCTLLALLKSALINHFLGVHFLVVVTNISPQIKSLVLVSNLTLALLSDALNAAVVGLSFAHDILLNGAKVSLCFPGLFIHFCLQVKSPFKVLSLVAIGSEMAVLGVDLNLLLYVSHSLFSRGNMEVEGVVALAV
jgi:hypothetical protein